MAIITGGEELIVDLLDICFVKHAQLQTKLDKLKNML